MSSLDAVRVELYLNRLRVNSEFSGEAVTLRQAIEGVEDLGLPAIREMLQLLQGYNIAVEGYDRFGNRYPASILLDMTLTQAGLSGLSYRLYDPSEQEINEFRLVAEEVLRSNAPGMTGTNKLVEIRKLASKLFNIEGLNIAYMVVNNQPIVAISSRESAATGMGIFLNTEFLLERTGNKKQEAQNMQELMQGLLFSTFNVWNSRKFDSEVILFENLRQFYDRMPVDQREALRGLSIPIKLFTERPPCRSCQFVMAQFVKYMQFRYGINFEIRLDWDRGDYKAPRRQRPNGDRNNWASILPDYALEFFWTHDDPSQDAEDFIMYSREWWEWYGQRQAMPLYSPQWYTWWQNKLRDIQRQ